MSAREPARCAAPVGPGPVDGCCWHCALPWAGRGLCPACRDEDISYGDATEDECGEAATEERTVEGIVVHLCEEHARELDADAAEEPAVSAVAGGG